MNIPQPNVTIKVNQTVLLDMLDQIGRFTWQDQNGELWYTVTKNDGFNQVVLTNDDDWAEKYLFSPGNKPGNPS